MPAPYEGQMLVAQGGTVLAVRGEIDLHSAPRFKQDLLDATQASQGVLCIDLSSLAFIDSRGLGVLVGVRARLLEQGRSLVLVVTAANVKKAFTVTGLDQVFDIVDSRGAVASLADSTEPLAGSDVA